MISKHTPKRSGVKYSQLHLITAWVLGRLHCWIGPGIFNSPQCSHFFGTTFWFIPNSLLHGQESIEILSERIIVEIRNTTERVICTTVKCSITLEGVPRQKKNRGTAASMTHCTKSHTEHILNLLAIQKLKSFYSILGKWGYWNGWDNISDDGGILIGVDDWKVYPQNSKYRASEGTVGEGGVPSKK